MEKLTFDKKGELVDTSKHPFDFLSFYDVLLSALKGKEVILRAYDKDNGLPENEHFEWEKYDEDGDGDGEIIGWSEKDKYTEWTGTVEDILFCDNSHVDIIFDKTKPHTCSSKKCYKDCFNWHMGSYIKIKL